MRISRLALLLALLAMFAAALMGCGSESCEGVDTSGPPDSVIMNGPVTTYRWGGCTKVINTLGTRKEAASEFKAVQAAYSTNQF